MQSTFINQTSPIIFHDHYLDLKYVDNSAHKKAVFDKFYMMNFYLIALLEYIGTCVFKKIGKFAIIYYHACFILYMIGIVTTAL